MPGTNLNLLLNIRLNALLFYKGLSNGCFPGFVIQQKRSVDDT